MALTGEQIKDLAKVLIEEKNKERHKSYWLDAIAAIRVLALESGYIAQNMLGNVRHYLYMLSLFDIDLKLGCILTPNNKYSEIEACLYNDVCILLATNTAAENDYLIIDVSHLKTLVNFIQKEKSDITSNNFVIDKERLRINYNKNKADLVREHEPLVNEFFLNTFKNMVNLFNDRYTDDEAYGQLFNSSFLHQVFDAQMQDRSSIAPNLVMASKIKPKM